MPTTVTTGRMTSNNMGGVAGSHGRDGNGRGGALM